MRSAIARPAASSLAELTRRPEDSRSIDVASELCDVFRLRWAFSEATLVLIVCGMKEHSLRNLEPACRAPQACEGAACCGHFRRRHERRCAEKTGIDPSFRDTFGYEVRAVRGMAV
jgi:hypothetical protein